MVTLLHRLLGLFFFLFRRRWRYPLWEVILGDRCVPFVTLSHVTCSGEHCKVDGLEMTDCEARQCCRGVDAIGAEILQRANIALSSTNPPTVLTLSLGNGCVLTLLTLLGLSAAGSDAAMSSSGFALLP